MARHLTTKQLVQLTSVSRELRNHAGDMRLWEVLRLENVHLCHSVGRVGGGSYRFPAANHVGLLTYVFVHNVRQDAEYDSCEWELPPLSYVGGCFTRGRTGVAQK